MSFNVDLDVVGDIVKQIKFTCDLCGKEEVIFYPKGNSLPNGWITMNNTQIRADFGKTLPRD